PRPGQPSCPGHPRVRGRSAVFFRSGTVVPADLLTSQGNASPAGDLRSAGITPVHRYYVPLRLPLEPGGGYAFPSSVVLSPCPGVRPLEGASQVPGRSVDARRPLPPRGARPLRVLVAW